MKQLNIHNTPGGLIWQVYHVKNQTEINMLTATARSNGFISHSINNTIDDEETWPNWRDTKDWIERIKDVTMEPNFLPLTNYTTV